MPSVTLWNCSAVVSIQLRRQQDTQSTTAGAVDGLRVRTLEDLNRHFYHQEHSGNGPS